MSQIIKPFLPVVNWSHPLAKGIVFDAPVFERGGLKTQDISKYKLTGTFMGGLPATAWGLGLYGAQLTNDGTSKYVDFGTTPTQTNLNRGFSVFALIKPATVSASNGIITRGSGGWYLRISATGKVNFLQSQTTDILAGLTTLAINTWNLVGFTIDNAATGNIVIYLNGKSDNTGTTAVSLGTGNHFLLGTDVNGSSVLTEPFNGSIALARVWNRIITPAEARALYVNPFQVYQKPPTQYASVLTAMALNRMFQINQSINRAANY